jgi:para-nitrobenzyl esterase
MMHRLTLLALLAGASIVSAAIPEPVKVDTGLITGTTTTSDDVRVFKGIPLAAPPAKWEGVRKADQFGPTCLPNRGGSEDCLYINVWTGAKGGERCWRAKARWW